MSVDVQLVPIGSVRPSAYNPRVTDPTLMIPRDVFDHWQQQLYDEVGMATDDIVAEIRRRLGL
jgi:hypothetical protein